MGVRKTFDLTFCNLIAALFITVLVAWVGWPSSSKAEDQKVPLACVVQYKDQTKPMHWFPQSGAPGSYHSDEALDPLKVIIKEKTNFGRYEIVIVEAIDDNVWEKFVEVLDKSDADNEMKNKLRQLGRTRITTQHVGLYNGVLQIEHRLGTDKNLYTISCQENSKP